MSKNILIKLEIVAPDLFYDQVWLDLFEASRQGWQEITLWDGCTNFVIYSENKEFIEALATSLKKISGQIKIICSQESVPDPLEAWKEFFTPVLCGKNFVVLPPWLKNENFGDRHKILIEPKSAFGTGHHATTALCLTALSALLDRKLLHPGDKFLDLGCGTAVLSLAASMAGLSGLAVDLDPVAIINARQNCQLNNINDIELLEGSITAMPRQEFDLIMANILAEPLIAMSREICSYLKKNGKLILSGILRTQADVVQAAYLQCGLNMPEIMNEGEWSCLIFIN